MSDAQAIVELPNKIQELLHGNEKILYASRPSQNALIISMVVSGIVWSAIGLMAYGIGIILTLPIALLVTYFSWKNKYYVITEGRTIVSQGIFNVAIKVILNSNIQLVSINTGIVDRWLKLNSVELFTAAQGGSGGILALFPGVTKGCVTLKHVVVRDVIRHYAQV